jgi:hypothetical protein
MDIKVAGINPIQFAAVLLPDKILEIINIIKPVA